MSKSGFTSPCIFILIQVLLWNIPSHAQWVQRGSVLSSVTAGSFSAFGRSVSISTDGSTLIVGGANSTFGTGAAWPFTMSGIGYGGTGFTEVNNYIVGSGYIDHGSSIYTVSISSDGQTAVVSDPSDNYTQGAFWIFTFNGTAFVQVGTKFVGTGSVATSNQGYSISISGDGKTIAVGGLFDDPSGAVWIYTFDGSNFVQFGNKLVGTGSVWYSSQGSSVSLSTDAKTLIVGGERDNYYKGAAWIFTFNGSNFVQVGNKLVGTGMQGSITGMGSSISISGDGKTAIVGGDLDNNGIGASWIFTFNGSNFVQLGSKMVGSGNIGASSQGRSVAISSDGKSAVVGAPNDNGNNGAIWTYINTGDTFKEVGKIVSGGYGYQLQGISVSISGDGKTIISGAIGDDAAFIYYNPNPPCFYPTVTGVSTFAGICEGSNPVLTITAKGLPHPLSYQWYKDNNSITGANDSTLALTGVTTSVGGIYTCSVSNICGSTTSDGINITVTPFSTLTGNVLPGPVCPGNQVTITGSGSSDIFVSGGLPFASGFVPSVSGIYTLQDTTNICVLPAVVTVTVKNLPSLTISGNNPICPGGTSVLNVSGASNYLWSTGSTLSGISVSPLTVISYVVTGTGLNSCTTIASVIVTVTGPVSIPVNGNTSVCTGDSIHLSVSRHITKVKWSTGDTTTAISLLPNSNFILTLSGITDQGCQGEGSVNIIVTGPVSIPVNGNAFACKGDSIHLSVNQMTKVKWSTGDTTTAIALLPVVNSLLTLSGITDQGCQGEGFVNLTVNSLPVVNLDISQADHLCNTVGSVALSGGNPSGGIYLYNGAIISQLNINQPGDYPIIYQYKDQNACVNTATGILTVMLCTVPGPCDLTNPPCTCPGYTCPPHFKIYNAFSPNNDNVNEIWIIDSLPEQNQVMIIDKWGNEVFKAAPYHNDWQGKSDAKDLPVGIYYYLLEIEQKRKFSGTVSIIR